MIYFLISIEQHDGQRRIMIFLLYTFLVFSSMTAMQHNHHRVPAIEPQEITVYKQHLYATQEKLTNAIVEHAGIAPETWPQSASYYCNKSRNRDKKVKNIKDDQRASPYYSSMIQKLFSKHNIPKDIKIFNSTAPSIAGTLSTSLHINEDTLNKHFRDKQMLKSIFRHEITHLLGHHYDLSQSLIELYLDSDIACPSELFQLHHITELIADIDQHKKPHHIDAMIKALATAKVLKINNYLNKYGPKNLETLSPAIQEKWLKKAIAIIDAPDAYASHPPLGARMDILRHLQDAWKNFKESHKSKERPRKETLPVNSTIDHAAYLLLSMKNNTS